MLTLIGPNSTVHFTSLSKASLESLRKELSSSTSNHQSANFELHTSSITTLIKERNWKLDRICLLDPRAEKGLNVRDAGFNRKEEGGEKEDGESFFTHFLFGGILGDDPPRDRTSSLRQLGFPGRHLGTVQMTTDTAMGVTKRVVEDGLCLNLEKKEGEKVEVEDESGPSITWVNMPELKFGGGESVEMPFRYMAEDPSAKILKPLMPPGMRELIRSDLDRAFEF